MIFGTHKLVRILSPSLRALPLSGIEYSFQLRDAGYCEDGFKESLFRQRVEMSEWEMDSLRLDGMID